MRERVSSRRLRRGLRVLIFDEHPGSRRMLGFVVMARGHQCVATSSPQEAMVALADFRADAIVYDWNTRGGQLRGLARSFRQTPHVHAVVVTSSLDEPPQFCDEEALDGYFTKPLAMGEVVDRLEIVVRSRRG